jgi:outer membrane protein OmpA-like peptidoglycan-associated protein
MNFTLSAAEGAGSEGGRAALRLAAIGLAIGLAAATVIGAPALPAHADDRAPVREIVAPVVDIAFGEADLKQLERVEKSKRRTTITLSSTVLSRKYSDMITAAARERLARVAGDLTGQVPGSVRITGYTDDLGSRAHGKDLSQRRAKAVGNVLRRDLVEHDHPFTLVGKGEDDPAVPNTSEANRKKNWRVVIVFDQTLN